MDFKIKEKAVAGSIDSILSDKSVASVFGVFGDCYMQRYGIDIREKRSIYNSKVARQVKSFSDEFGEDDAKMIVRRLYSPSHDGSYKGEAIGVQIFSKGKRWLANILLLEAYDESRTEGIRWKTF